MPGRKVVKPFHSQVLSAKNRHLFNFGRTLIASLGILIVNRPRERLFKTYVLQTRGEVCVESLQLVVLNTAIEVARPARSCRSL